MLVFVRLNPDRFKDPRYAGLENRLYRAELIGQDEVRIEMPDGSWQLGDPAHFHVRSGALPTDRS